MQSESDPSAPSVAGPPAAEGAEAPASGAPGTGYRVTLPVFEGPLDLLLHLIRINQIAITDIPIVEITRQYNQTLELMRELNLEVAGEYLVMAATLLHIKSRMLLPPDPTAPGEAPADPRADLVRQLEEYGRFREAARQLGEADQEYLRTWGRPASAVAAFEGEAAVVADLFSLLTAFRRMLEAMGRQERVALQRERISLLDRIHWLLGRLGEQRRSPFSSLFEGAATRAELIVTFLALLELVRLRVVGAVQTDRFGEIDILLLEDPDSIRIDSERILNA